MSTLKEQVDQIRFYPSLKTIVITGGPCAGKSTFLKMATHMLKEHGFKIFVIPEVARELILAGIFPTDPSWINTIDFQKHVLLAIIEKENRYLQAILDQKINLQKVIIFCDRGLADGMAYCDRHDFDLMLGELEISATDIIDRYTGVIHLVTAAYGAEEFYIQDEARFETADKARELDDSTFNAWLSHQHVQRIDNSTTFPEKINRALKALKRIVPMPEQQEIERKYLVNGSLKGLLNGAECFRISQHYLDIKEKPGIECRVRKKTVIGKGSSFYYTEKTLTKVDGVRGEFEEQISETKYDELIRLYSHPACKPVGKVRFKTRYNNYVLEIDIYEDQLSGLIILEVEFPSIEESEAFVPPNVELKEVTKDKRYSNRMLAEFGIPIS